MSDRFDEIKAYWDQQAVLSRQEGNDVEGLNIYDANRNLFYQPGGGGTSKDLILKRLETETLERHLKLFRPNSILEVGCGSGVMTMELARRLNEGGFHGTDYSSEMVANANASLATLDASLRSRLSFEVADVLSLSARFSRGRFNAVTTDRCLINLPGWELQQRAIHEIHAILGVGGIFLMLEGSEEALAKLNSVRQDLGLQPIRTVWHNLFFEEGRLLPFLETLFHIQVIDSFCSTYMLISRALFHRLRDQNQSIDEQINHVGSLLPNMGDYGYLKLFVLIRK